MPARVFSWDCSLSEGTGPRAGDRASGAIGCTRHGGKDHGDASLAGRRPAEIARPNGTIAMTVPCNLSTLLQSPRTPCGKQLPYQARSRTPLPFMRIHTRKRETFAQCRLHVGPESATLAQHSISNGSGVAPREDSLRGRVFMWIISDPHPGGIYLITLRITPPIVTLALC